jgi:hypothetical protein
MLFIPVFGDGNEITRQDHITMDLPRRSKSAMCKAESTIKLVEFVRALLKRPNAPSLLLKVLVASKSAKGRLHFTQIEMIDRCEKGSLGSHIGEFYVQGSSEIWQTVG